MASELEKFAQKHASASTGQDLASRAPVIWSPDESYTRVAHGTHGLAGGRAGRGFQVQAGALTGSPSGPSVVRGMARPFHPLFSSPDRLQLPTQLAQLNQYWRLYYNMDPVIGGAIDMHADMPWSEADLNMDDPSDESQEIVQVYEDMLNRTELLSYLPKLTREYFIIGEVFPFLFWDETDGIFTHLTLHNPDFIEVIDSPMIGVDPVLTLRPSAELRRLMNSTDRRYMKLRSKIPPDFLAMLAAGQNIPLDPINASHIARKAFPYDTRGVSILARLFRILMYEDAVFQGQIQQAQRHALPLRLFKIGDQQRGWMPSKQQQEEFIEMLAEAEVDPLAAIVYHYGLTAEYLGMEGKQLKISVEWDVIERAKLIALGVNKAFIHGEVTYASANAGLQVLMMRHRTFRDMIMSDWVYKKVFATVADLNGFTRPIKKTDSVLPDTRDPSMDRRTMNLSDKLRKIAELKDPNEQIIEFERVKGELAEVNNFKRVATRRITMGRQAAAFRSKRKPGHRLVYPKLQFDKRLDVRQETDILRVWGQMVKDGYISPRSYVQGAGLDYDSEQANITKDAAYIAKNKLLMQVLEKGGDEGGVGGAAGGVGIGSSLTDEGEGAEAPAGGEEAGEGAGAPGSGEAASRHLTVQTLRRTGSPEAQAAAKQAEQLERSAEKTDVFTRAGGGERVGLDDLLKK